MKEAIYRLNIEKQFLTALIFGVMTYEQIRRISKNMWELELTLNEKYL